MLNYIKSEIYRVTHSREIYYLTGILSALAVLVNLVLFFVWRMDGSEFPYANTSYSYSQLVSTPMLFCMMGAVVGMILYEGNRRNGNLKNTIAFGVSRTKIFAGQCVVSVMSAVAVMIIVLIFYIISAILLLEQTGPVGLTDLLTEIPAVFLVAVAALISGIACMERFENLSGGLIVWLLCWFLIPKVCYYLGLRFDVMYRIAMWMPDNFFGNAGMLVNTTQCITAWRTPEGMAKCVLAGLIGVVIFSLAGVAILRKKEM